MRDLEGAAEASRRCGFVALIGAPNAGKSTLVNRLVGAKVSIVTHKVQTTRTRLRGIMMSGQSQIILVDTPGIFEPKKKLERAMVESAWGGVEDADLSALIVDSRAGLSEATEHIVAGLEGAGRKAVLCLNKIDTLRRDKLLAIAQTMNERFAFDATFFISAQTGEGLADLERHFAAAVPEGPWLYPEDQVADAPMRFLAAEVTREKIFVRLHQELPYSSTVETESWKEQKDGSVRIEQVIFVQRESQRKIVLGKGGQTIKEIGRQARVELQETLERPVHLFLFVKVRENWTEDPERYRQMGLELS
ncbi:MAG: GTPase Era [Pseudomonadota bacterium]